jgi:glutamyl-Q tRNA(Asp) synthetase
LPRSVSANHATRSAISRGPRSGTPERTPQYIGRFAPSPTGKLHLGSLVAALGSYADARSRGGRWLVRMEDLDRARVRSGAADEILRTLEMFGLHWDGRIEYQSERTEHYRVALEALTALGATFECSCSRREREGEGGYPGTCRAGPRRSGPTATRFRVEDVVVSVEDRLQGRCDFRLGERGDVIIRRRDGAFAYQLAVVVDDALQGVTDVVRGADLLDSTPWQIALQQAMKLPTPRYAHLPLVTEPSGEKLAKSKRSVPLDPASAGRQLYQALRLLQQDPPAALESEPAAVVLEWACVNWGPHRLRQVREVAAAGYGTTIRVGFAPPM